MVRIAPCVGMEQANPKTAAVRSLPWKQVRQIPLHIAPGIAVPVYAGPFRIVGEHGHGLDLVFEADTSGWQIQAGLPSVQRVVVAVADEGADAGVIQTFETLHELQLGPQAAVGAVVHVSRHQECIHTFVQTQLDDVVVGAECGLAQCGRHMVGRVRLHACKRAIQMQVGSMDKSQCWHLHTGMDCRGGMISLRGNRSSRYILAGGLHPPAPSACRKELGAEVVVCG